MPSQAVNLYGSFLVIFMQYNLTKLSGVEGE